MHADDATAGGCRAHLQTRWNHLVNTGQDFGYYLKVFKTWLVVKEDGTADATTEPFRDRR